MYITQFYRRSVRKSTVSEVDHHNEIDKTDFTSFIPINLLNVVVTIVVECFTLVRFLLSAKSLNRVPIQSFYDNFLW